MAQSDVKISKQLQDIIIELVPERHKLTTFSSNIHSIVANKYNSEIQTLAAFHPF